MPTDLGGGAGTSGQTPSAAAGLVAPPAVTSPPDNPASPIPPPGVIREIPSST